MRLITLLLLAVVGAGEAGACLLTESTRLTHPTSWCGVSPTFSSALEITDDSPEELTDNFPFLASPMTRTTPDQLTFAYWVETSGGAAHGRVRHRNLNTVSGVLDSNSTDTWGTALTEDDSGHQRPSVASDRFSNLLVMMRTTDLTDCFTDPTRRNAACIRAGATSLSNSWLPSRLAQTLTTSDGIYDITVVEDRPTGCTYVMAEATNNASWSWGGEGAPSGLHRAFWRICGSLSSAGSYDGPYAVMDAATGVVPTDTASFDFCGAGNIFNKGRLLLGVDRSTLHMLWTRDNTFFVCDIPGTDARYVNCAPNCASGPNQLVEWQADLYYAFSRDQGRTWCNLSGATCTASVTTKISDSNTAYRVYQGEIRPNTEYQWDIGPSNDLYILLMEHDGDSTDLISGRPDWGLSPTPGANLRILRLRPGGSAATYPVFASSSIITRHTVLTGGYGELVVIGEQPLDYRRSLDHGSTFTPPSTLPGSGGTDNRAAYYRDPFHRGLVHLLYSDSTGPTDGNLFHRSIRLWR